MIWIAAGYLLIGGAIAAYSYATTTRPKGWPIGFLAVMIGWPLAFVPWERLRLD